MAGRSKRDCIPLFLDALRRSPNVAAAAHATGVDRRTVYRWRESDPKFAAAWDDAFEQSTDALVGESYRRAFKGTDKPVFYEGSVCGHVREFSDTLAIFLLKSHRPKVYRETIRQELSGPDGGPIPHETTVNTIYGDRDRQTTEAESGEASDAEGN